MTNQLNDLKAYDVDLYVTEIYDQFETQRDDITILREQIGDQKPLKILEPFCGNGRIFIPLAKDGHKITGLDKSAMMLESAHRKIKRLPVKIQKNMKLRQTNVLTEEWPKGFDLVILGGNCLYELATLEEQETCIRKAQQSVKHGGYLYLDNDHMEGDLAPFWRKSGVNKAFPTGICADGTKVEGFTELIGCDVNKRIVQYRRTVRITTPNGKTNKTQWHEQCHAPSTIEMKSWLKKYGFTILEHYGDRLKLPYTDSSERAVFWARLGVK